jgi:hypothetical protein
MLSVRPLSSIELNLTYRDELQEVWAPALSESLRQRDIRQFSCIRKASSLPLG